MDRDGRSDAGDAAAGTARADRIDLSVAVNRSPWPVADLPPPVRDTPAPRATAADRLTGIAAGRFGCLPSQIRMVADDNRAVLSRIARLLPAGRAAVIAPGRDSYAHSLRAAGWRVCPVPTPLAMAGADLAVVVNPNAQDGRAWRTGDLIGLARHVGHLIVDEGLADARPDLSLSPALPANALILRNLRAFWGLAGLRLGLVVAHPGLLARLSDEPAPDESALRIAALAMADRTWTDDTIFYLAEAALRLDRMATAAGWRVAGGTHLFRFYDTPDAAAAQRHLAHSRIRVQRFRWSDLRLRLAIPRGRDEWDRLGDSLRKIQAGAPSQRQWRCPGFPSRAALCNV
ncbi:threonine-phosphate decarboxylase [Paracoccus sediminis]|uniref:L-threonine O-3-phosphate decarboxylase n=1 Tax=Paracoccus sediminis TaxID=1214787 RepID=A0A238Y495_9RHOB|nr:hypothetical protein [Paracoccus sediminis]TBN47252.1 threonine-phosphate decarboxylase [Paracoccus sediminis]SNR65850.1 L-threonine O-3-phosphate decarboxylase [Paracoccus sediminis]